MLNIRFVVEHKQPHTPPGTPPASPPASPATSRTPSNASNTPVASPVDVTTIDEGAWRTEGGSDGLNMIAQDKEGTLRSENDIAVELKPPDLTDSTCKEEIENKQEKLEYISSEGGDKGLSEDSSIVASHKHIAHKVETTSEDSENFRSPEVKQGGEIQPVTKETIPEPVYEPVIELPPEFPVRQYWQDDSLVYDFLVSGLDYEDASYLKIGFENLFQVGSDSVVNAQWSFHPSILFMLFYKKIDVSVCTHTFREKENSLYICIVTHEHPHRLL